MNYSTTHDSKVLKLPFQQVLAKEKVASRVAVLIPEAYLMNLSFTVMSEMLARKDARALEKHRQTPSRACR